MKRSLLALFAFISLSVSTQDLVYAQENNDTISEEEKNLAYYIVEMGLLNSVDSIIQEGLYMRALNILDTLNVFFEHNGVKPSTQWYLRKGQIFMNMEEWQELVDITKECVNFNNNLMSDQEAGLIYSIQGMGYRNLEEYRNAIHSYEISLGFYNNISDLGNMGDMLCSIANCYSKLDKLSAASSFYKKGLPKFLQYFNTTKEKLLHSYFTVEDSYKLPTLHVFGCHLLNMAILEQDLGNHTASKEYLLMAAHCGDSTAESEYQRIYGK